MARLSEEHFRATGALPTLKSTRTSDFMRSVFKPRRSTSSTSPKTLVKPAPTPMEIARKSSTSRQLFLTSTEKIEERPAEDCEGDIAEATSTIPSLADAQTRRTSPSPLCDLHVDDKISLNAGTGSISVISDATPAQTNTQAEHDAWSNMRISASNIFDSQDALSTGIRAFVDSKIAKALHRHAYVCANDTPINITAGIELGNSREKLPSSSQYRISIDASIFHGPKHVGPLVLEYSTNTYNLQMGIIGIYMLATLFTAFIGPKTLFLTLWRLSVALITYCVAGQALGWHINAQDDLFLAPVMYAAGFLRDMLYNHVAQHVALQIRSVHTS